MTAAYDTEWGRLARASGRCRAIADDLDLDAKVTRSLPNGANLARYIELDAANYRGLASQTDTKARELHAAAGVSDGS